MVMLALLLQRELEKSWQDLDITVEAGIDELAKICMQDISLGKASVQNIPTPGKMGVQLLSNVGVSLPSVLPSLKPNVHTKKKLQDERK